MDYTSRKPHKNVTSSVSYMVTQCLKHSVSAFKQNKWKKHLETHDPMVRKDHGRLDVLIPVLGILCDHQDYNFSYSH